jgi:hypothetical protein
MTSTEICNKALAHLGDARISDFHEVSVAAEKCRTHYDHERDSLLRLHRWNFARARTLLTRLVQKPAFGWAFQYAMPADCLRVLEFNGVESGLDHDDHFELEGGRLLTDAGEGWLVYTKRVTDASLYDVLFCDALAYKLAAALCKEITNSNSEKGALLQMFERSLRDAGWTDAVETRSRVVPPTRGSRTLAARAGTVF